MTPVSDWLSGAVGGAMIGASSIILMLLIGRIAGISGIVGNALERGGPERLWRMVFIAGLIVGPLIVAALGAGELSAIRIDMGWPVLVAGGLLVGFGTRMSGGCTSGHGICGLAQLNQRSFAAVAVFFVAALVTVFVVRRLIGG